MSREFGHGPLDFRSMPPAIKALVVTNAAVFLLSMVVGGEFTNLFGLVPSHVVHDRWVWQPFTYLFLHGNFFHLLFNLFALWMFGMPTIAQWGPREFLKYFFLTGVGAGLVSVAAAPHSGAAIIGASGAIYGLLVAFAMLYPDAVVYLYFFFPIKAKHMAILFGLMEFFAGASAANPPSARLAHLSGMVIGYLYIRWSWVVGLRLRSFMASFGGGEDRPVPSRPVRRQPAAGGTALDERTVDEAAEVDRILDKILEHGEGSLTPRERDVLKRQAKKRPPEGRA